MRGQYVYRGVGGNLITIKITISYSIGILLHNNS